MADGGQLRPSGSDCSIEGCGEPAAARGWCKYHYGNWYRRGDPLAGRVRARYAPGTTCSVAACLRPVLARHLCGFHWQRWRKYGDPLATSGRTPPGERAAYFRAHVDDVTPDCMIWPYPPGKAGYGQVWIDGVQQYVHVLACEARHGPKPLPGMQAAHGPCHDRRCFNGDHLSWKTPKAHAQDKYRDGTQPLGSKHWNSNLTESEVREARDLYATSKFTPAQLAERYGVDRNTIKPMLDRRTWAHVS